ncbi:MAG: YqeG family HAD IIIA-type phosphatase [bacterium]|nr:YqeG family HAD IIIA-type phosphatase [bacterium]
MRIKPDYNLESIYDIDVNELKNKGIKGIFFDLDSTVMQSKTGKFTKKTLDFLNSLQKDFKVAIISNNHKKGYIDKVQKISPVKVYGNARKPDVKILKIACFELGLEVKEVAMVGDRPLTDILAGKKVGMKTILVDSISKNEEGILVRFVRFLERLTVKK